MKFTILGSGTSTGVPMVGCGCPVCSSDDPRDKRTRSSLLIQHQDKNILVDTTTDLRSQALREGLKHIDAVLFTHSHADHVNGIDDMRGFHFLNRQVVPCFAAKDTLEILQNSFRYIFDNNGNEAYPPIMQPNLLTERLELFGLNIIPIPLEHGNMVSQGYRIGPLAYLTDCNAIPESSLELLQGVDILVIDGLRWNPHPFHFHIETAITAAKLVNARRTVLTHLSHDVLYADGLKRLPEGFEFAYDGMAFEYGDDNGLKVEGG
jgi:phosphoribosyl 1,2-cyclic phosphate phosphodiesterase